eukprot:3046994-Pleurochrysis_carterae.AAC.3
MSLFSWIARTLAPMRAWVRRRTRSAPKSSEHASAPPHQQSATTGKQTQAQTQLPPPPAELAAAGELHALVKQRPARAAQPGAFVQRDAATLPNQRVVEGDGGSGGGGDGDCVGGCGGASGGGDKHDSGSASGSYARGSSGRGGHVDADSGEDGVVLRVTDASVSTAEGALRPGSRRFYI